MESIAIPIAGALMGFLLLKVLCKPLKWGLKMILNSAAGILTLWAVNALTGISVPWSAGTVLAAGFFGLPGLGLWVLLEKLI